MEKLENVDEINNKSVAELAGQIHMLLVLNRDKGTDFSLAELSLAFTEVIMVAAYRAAGIDADKVVDMLQGKGMDCDVKVTN